MRPVTQSHSNQCIQLRHDTSNCCMDLISFPLLLEGSTIIRYWYGTYSTQNTQTPLQHGNRFQLLNVFTALREGYHSHKWSYVESLLQSRTIMPQSGSWNIKTTVLLWKKTCENSWKIWDLVHSHQPTRPCAPISFQKRLKSLLESSVSFLRLSKISTVEKKEKSAKKGAYRSNTL